MLRIINLDRVNCIAHVPLDTTHDRGIVVDDDHLVAHPITGEMMPSRVYSGTIPQCVEYARSQHDHEPQHPGAVERTVGL